MVDLLKKVDKNIKQVSPAYFRFLLQIRTVEEDLRELGRLEVFPSRSKQLLEQLGLKTCFCGDYLLFSKKEKTIKEAKESLNSSENSEWTNRKLGNLFGYPDCCIEHFNKNIDLMIAEEDLRLKIKTISKHTSGKISWLLNNFTYFSFTIHHNCSYNCEKSIEKAKKYSHLINKFSKKTHKKAEEKSKGVLVVDEVGNKSTFFKKYKKENGKIFIGRGGQKEIPENENLKTYIFN